MSAHLDPIDGLRPAAPDEFCCVHGVIEPSQPGDFHWCFECGHVWRTEDEFRADRDRILREVFPRAAPTSKVFARPLTDETCCPLCAHDFFFAALPASVRVSGEEQR